MSDSFSYYYYPVSLRLNPQPGGNPPPSPPTPDPDRDPALPNPNPPTPSPDGSPPPGDPTPPPPQPPRDPPAPDEELRDSVALMIKFRQMEIQGQRYESIGEVIQIVGGAIPNRIAIPIVLGGKWLENYGKDFQKKAGELRKHHQEHWAKGMGDPIFIDIGSDGLQLVAGYASGDGRLALIWGSAKT